MTVLDASFLEATKIRKGVMPRPRPYALMRGIQLSYHSFNCSYMIGHNPGVSQVPYE